MLRYPVFLTPDVETGAVLVGFPDIEFCHSVGDDEAEALLNAEDALISALEIFIDQRLPIPMPSTAKTTHSVILPALITSKVLLWNEMQAQGVRKAELAQRLDCHLPQVDRLLNLGHSSKIEQTEAALTQLGRQLDAGLA